MLISNFEYVPLRLLRRFVVTGPVLQRLTAILPYYEASQNEASSAPIVAAYEHHLARADATFRGADVVEIGSGRTNSVGYALARGGARRVVCFEPHAGFDRDADARLLAATATAAAPAAALAAQVERTTSLSTVADASADLALSSSVLEHVRDLRGLLAELGRVLRPGGAMLHLVDYRDHFFKYPFHFLQFSERAWRRWLDPGDLPRWRLSGQLRILDEMGYRVNVLARTRDDDGYRRIAPYLAAGFDAADPEIAVTHAALFVQRGGPR